jgi:hypothetical protein
VAGRQGDGSVQRANKPRRARTPVAKFDASDYTGAFLSSDGLIFTASDETPTALSIVWQSTTSQPTGIIYGQGVRCVRGTIKRLFVKNAVAGSNTAPDYLAGDPTVSARSAANGDVIQPGQSRGYLVCHRDPTVLGGCPATRTFNATQTGRVDWSF